MKEFATLYWSVEDITQIWKVTNEEAESILTKLEEQIVNEMVSAGYRIIEDHMKAFDKVEDENGCDVETKKSKRTNNPESMGNNIPKG